MEIYYGQKIKNFRIAKGLTQENFANQLGISSSMLGMIEQGSRKPNEEIQEKLLSLTGISYYDEIIKQITKEIRDTIIDYITLNSVSFSPNNVTKIIRNLSALYNSIDASEKTIKTYLIENKNDQIEYMTFNLVNLLEAYTQNCAYNIKKIFGNNNNFMKHSILIVINILQTSSSIIFKHKEVPLYKENLPLEIGKNNIKSLLSESYFPDKSKFAFIVQDDDMFPKYEKGYTVIAIGCDEKNTSGDVILSINKSTPILRKISFKDKYAIVESYNPKIETELFVRDEIRILGQIIEIRLFNQD